MLCTSVVQLKGNEISYQFLEVSFKGKPYYTTLSALTLFLQITGGEEEAKISAAETHMCAFFYGHFPIDFCSKSKLYGKLSCHKLKTWFLINA